MDELIKTLEGDEKIGANIIRRAIEEPLRMIVMNAGEEGAVVIGKIHDSTESNFGYNAGTNKYEDLVAAGVIDPTKVTRTALQNAASIAGLMLTTEAMISRDSGEEGSRPLACGRRRRRDGRHVLSLPCQATRKGPSYASALCCLRKDAGFARALGGGKPQGRRDETAPKPGAPDAGVALEWADDDRGLGGWAGGVRSDGLGAGFEWDCCVRGGWAMPNDCG